MDREESREERERGRGEGCTMPGVMKEEGRHTGAQRS